jgi:predicted enzyme related to lactoylglutathione lyase
VARDWRRLAAFYQAVFGCRQVGPERDLQGPWVDRLTAVDVRDPEGNAIELQRWERNAG